MNREQFEKIIAEEFPKAVPEKFLAKIKNIGFLVEEEPSFDVRRDFNLSEDETLFGLYTGIPLTERGDGYGIGPTLPDTIIIYKKPIEEESGGDIGILRKVVRETIWHEVAHYFGFGEKEVEEKEIKKNADAGEI